MFLNDSLHSGRIVKHLHCSHRLKEIRKQKGKEDFSPNKHYSLLHVYK